MSSGDPQHRSSAVRERTAEEARMQRQVGAVSVRGRPVRRAPLGWLPWAALLLAVVLGVAALLIARTLGDAGADPGVTVGDRALLPIPAEGLASFRGRAVEGRSVNVESVVADEGFWVGDSRSRRIFVFLTDRAERDAERDVEPGDEVDFTGTLRPLPADLSTFGIDPADGADQLRRQGHHVEVRSLSVDD